MEGDDVVCYCPRHNDANPSFRINRRTLVWICRSTCGEGGPIERLCRELKLDLPDGAIAKSGESAIDARYHSEVSASQRVLWSEPGKETLERLRKDWGIDDATIRSFQLGWHERLERLMIPVYIDGELINIRQYKFNPGKREAKVLNVKGVKQVLPFPESPLLAGHESLLIAEGEKDAIVATFHGLPAVTFTGGAERMPSKAVLSRFAGIVVKICYDNDDAGRKGAQRLSRILAGIARQVWVVDIGKAPNVGPKGDITEFFQTGGTRAEFDKLCREAKLVWPTKIEPDSKDETVHKLSLSEARTKQFYNCRCKVRIQVLGKKDSPFFLPVSGDIACTAKQDKAERCQLCLFNRNDALTIPVKLADVEQGESLLIIACPETQQKAALSRLFKCNCDLWDWNMKLVETVEAVIVSQDTNFRRFDDELSETYQPVTHKCYYIGTLPMHENLSYVMTGRCVADPRTQEVTHIFTVGEPKSSQYRWQESGEELPPNFELGNIVRTDVPEAQINTDMAEKRADEK
jgi:hypothetical protein